MSWQDASIAITGTFLVIVLGSVLIWQIFKTGRTGLSAKREDAYRRLAEEATSAQLRTAEGLSAHAESIRIRL